MRRSGLGSVFEKKQSLDAQRFKLPNPTHTLSLCVDPCVETDIWGRYWSDIMDMIELELSGTYRWHVHELKGQLFKINHNLSVYFFIFAFIFNVSFFYILKISI